MPWSALHPPCSPCRHLTSDVAAVQLLTPGIEYMSTRLPDLCDVRALTHLEMHFCTFPFLLAGLPALKHLTLWELWTPPTRGMNGNPRLDPNRLDDAERDEVNSPSASGSAHVQSAGSLAAARRPSVADVRSPARIAVVMCQRQSQTEPGPSLCFDMPRLLHAIMRR